MKKIPTVEVKRCFVVSNLVKAPQGKERYLGLLSSADFRKRLSAAKKKARTMSEKRLNKLISPTYPKRLRSYEACDWFLADFKTSELGVWRAAGGLPAEWTKGSLMSTAQKVKKALEKNGALAKRARRAIPSILATSVLDVQKEKYLLPIAFKAGTGTNGRRGFKARLKADLDDGCMRSIALAVHGTKSVRVYFGIPKPR